MTGKLIKTCAIITGLTSCVYMSTHHCAAAILFRTVAMTGEQAPGTDPGIVFRNVVSPVINQAGQVAFRGRVQGPGYVDDNDDGIWFDTNGTLNLVAGLGNLAPGFSQDGVFEVVENPTISDDGRIGFGGEVSGPGFDETNNRGIWIGPAGSLDLFAKTGQPAPGAAVGEVYRYLWYFVLDGSGHTTLRPTTGLAGSSDLAISISSDVSGPLTEVVSISTPVPGESNDIIFGLLTDPRMNSTGQIIFNTIHLDTSLDADPSKKDGAVWVVNNGVFDQVARSGQPAPGVETGGLFSGYPFGTPTINNAGQVAFTGRFEVPGGGSGFGLWVGEPSSLSFITGTGEQVPGMESGVTFASLSSSPILNGTGQVVFRADLTGPGIDNTNRTSIWLWDGDNLRLIAREGVAIPDTFLSAKFQTFYDTGITINEQGQVAFIADVTGRSQGIWYTDPSGSLRTLVLGGGEFDVNDDPLIQDLRTIERVSLIAGSGGEDGLPRSLNNSGQIVFELGFSRGQQGIFVATVPEPGALGLLGVGAGLVAGRRGKRVA